MQSNVKILKNSVLGRYTVAAADIKAGDILIDEFPFVYGPKQNTNVICLGCYSTIDGGIDGPRCSNCNWPLCFECELNGADDHSAECKIFTSAKVKFQSIPDQNCPCPQLDCITPLRLLLKKEKFPDQWENLVECMEYHDIARRKNIDVWNADLINIAKYLRGPCKLARFSEDLIMRIIGILEINAFEAITQIGNTIRGLYPLSAVPAHNCVPNAYRCIYPSDKMRMALRAMVDIKTGDQINVSYTHTLNGTAGRQNHLRTGKFFICHCQRCTDPTELGTNFSSLRCSQCESGYLITTDPFNKDAEWKCEQCSKVENADSISDVLDSIESRISSETNRGTFYERLMRLEALYKNYSTTLHHSHYILTKIRKSLLEMYTCRLNCMTDDSLKSIQLLCHSLLDTLNIFEPGLSRSRALILYELHFAIIKEAEISFEQFSITQDDKKRKFLEAIGMLEECINILKYDDRLSFEGMTFERAKEAMDSLKDVTKICKFINQNNNNNSK